MLSIFLNFAHVNIQTVSTSNLPTYCDLIFATPLRIYIIHHYLFIFYIVRVLFIIIILTQLIIYAGEFAFPYFLDIEYRAVGGEMTLDSSGRPVLCSPRSYTKPLCTGLTEKMVLVQCG